MITSFVDIFPALINPLLQVFFKEESTIFKLIKLLEKIRKKSISLKSRRMNLHESSRQYEINIYYTKFFNISLPN